MALVGLLPSPGLSWRFVVEWLVVYVAFPLLMAAAVFWFGVQIERRVVSEIQDVVDEVVGRLTRVRDEIVSLLEAAEEAVDLSGLVAVVDEFDALVEGDDVEDDEAELDDDEVVDEPVEEDVVVEDEPAEGEDDE